MLLSQCYKVIEKAASRLKYFHFRFVGLVNPKDSLIIQTDKGFYKASDTVKFRYKVDDTVCSENIVRFEG